MGLAPVHFRMAYRTIREFNRRSPLQLLPPTAAIELSKAPRFANSFAGRDGFNVPDPANDFESHRLYEYLSLISSPIAPYAFSSVFSSGRNTMRKCWLPGFWPKPEP